MLYRYEAIDSVGSKKSGNIDAINEAIAVSSLQKRGFVIVSITKADKKGLFNMEFTMFERITNKELVILSRQIATLFEAQVSALRIFRLLGEEQENPLLRKKMMMIGDDLQGGSSISDALAKHEKAFSPFFVNMVRMGEESGKLEQIFSSLADYLDRTYEAGTKARNALVYPAFVIGTFIIVMVLMLVLVIPRLASILNESGQEIPLYTKVVLAVSDLLVNYGIWVLVGVILSGVFLFRYSQTKEGAFFTCSSTSEGIALAFTI